MKKLSKAQRRALELTNSGKSLYDIHHNTYKWLEDNELVYFSSRDYRCVMVEKGQTWLENDRQRCPIAQCPNCGAWRSHNITSRWDSQPSSSFIFWCHAECPVGGNTFYWEPGDEYPEWIADE